MEPRKINLRDVGARVDIEFAMGINSKILIFCDNNAVIKLDARIFCASSPNFKKIPAQISMSISEILG